MTVRFSDTAEFAEELRKEAAADQVYRSIVRYTFRFDGDKDTQIIRRVYLVATFRGRTGSADGLGYDPGEIVKLERFVGELWSHGPERQAASEPDRSTIARMDEYRKAIDDLCRELNLEHRAGVWEP